MKLLTIAQYEEDLQWVDGLPAGWTPLVVKKGVDVPNVGREPYSFLWLIHRRYPEIKNSDTLAFVQGDPFAHCQNLYEYLDKLTVNEYTPLGDNLFISFSDGSPHHQGLEVAGKFNQWIGDWPGQAKFSPGGQFMVPGKLVKKHPRKHYRYLMKEMEFGENPWVMERLWGYLFSKA